MPPTREDVANTNDFFEMSLDHLCVAGFDGYFKRVNPSWTRTLGWTREELMASPSVDFVHADDREVTLASRQSLRRGLGMGPLVNRYRCKDGSYRWFEWRSIAHADRALVYAAARDVTEQRLADERLAEASTREETLRRQLTFADRMASVGTLADGVGHEINNPLSFIVSNLEFALEELRAIGGASPSKEIRELIDSLVEAREGSDRIRKIVRGLRALAREESAPVATDVAGAVEIAINMGAHACRHKATVTKKLAATPAVLSDESRLSQILVNLIVNAAEAFPTGDVEANHITITSAVEPDNQVSIAVSDNGPGIPAEIRGRIFDPFFTTKPVGQGTGLGLSICESIVSSLGGKIVLESEGRGTTFRVFLPVAEIGSALANSQITESIAGGARILVVDDEPALVRSFHRILENEHRVSGFTDAREALASVERGDQYDLIFCDIMMPHLSGDAFYERVRATKPELAGRFVFMSGGATSVQTRSFLESVPNERLEKPLRIQSLRSIAGRYGTRIP